MVTTELCIEDKLHTHSRDSRELCISFPFETAYVIFLYLTASTPHFMPQIMFHVSPFCHIVVHYFFSSFHTPFQNSTFSCFLTQLTLSHECSYQVIGASWASGYVHLFQALVCDLAKKQQQVPKIYLHFQY